MRSAAGASPVSPEPGVPHEGSSTKGGSSSKGTSSKVTAQETEGRNPFDAPADMFRQYKNGSFTGKDGSSSAKVTVTVTTPSSASSSAKSNQEALELAKRLDAFVSKARADAKKTSDGGESNSISRKAMADLQLKTARKLRQLIPNNNELLQQVQERHWIPLFLGWLNHHDRPAVQIEALMVLTDIAELCAQQSYYQGSTSAVAAAAAAAVKVAGVKANGLADSPFYFPTDPGNGTGASFPYPSMPPPTPGSVPFPPLSFSQNLSPEAVAKFDASLSSSIKQTKGQQSQAASSSTTAPASSSNSVSNAFASGVTSSLFASAMGAAGASGLTSNAMIPPPTPVGNSMAGESSVLHQLSPSSQHLLLRHADAIPTLVSVLGHPDRDAYEQAMWIIGSIAAGDTTASSSGNSSTSGDGSREKLVAARDVILAAGVMKQLLRCLEMHTTNLSLQRMGSWTLSNLVEGIFQQNPSKPTKSYNSSEEIDMRLMLPVLRRLLRMGDAEVLSYTCWVLSHLCDGPSSHIAAIVTTTDKKGTRGGLVPRLVELLLHASWRVTKPALRTIGNIVCAECSDDSHSTSSSPTDYTEIILECGAVPRLKELVSHGNREIQKEACWTLSNIAAGTVDQIQTVIDSGAIPPLVKLVGNKKTDQEVRSEACWVVLNATSCGSDSQIGVLVDEGCVSVLGVLLGESSMVMMALEGLERVLQVEESRELERRERERKGKGDGKPTPTLVSASLIQKALEKHNSSAVTKRASRIWKQHFVSCALCHESFSKHRTADATFCDECKCYVCKNCDCKVYHLSYQEELWADTEEKSEAKKNAKKSKNKKKKAKQKKAKQQPNVPAVDAPPSVPKPSNKEGSTARSLNSSDNSESAGIASGGAPNDKGPASDLSGRGKKARAAAIEDEDEVAAGIVTEASPEDDDGQQQQPPIDFVLYLQQTGSIIALAKLMDALEQSETEYNEDEFDDAELQMLRHHKAHNQQATN